ncbi:MAG: hypothetical protein V4684_07490 [Pseudomonadota bacterium]
MFCNELVRVSATDLKRTKLKQKLRHKRALMMRADDGAVAILLHSADLPQLAGAQ